MTENDPTAVQENTHIRGKNLSNKLTGIERLVQPVFVKSGSNIEVPLGNRVNPDNMPNLKCKVVDDVQRKPVIDVEHDVKKPDNKKLLDKGIVKFGDLRNIFERVGDRNAEKSKNNSQLDTSNPAKNPPNYRERSSSMLVKPSFSPLVGATNLKSQEKKLAATVQSKNKKNWKERPEANPQTPIDRFFPRKESLSNQDSPGKRKFTDDMTQFETPKKKRVGNRTKGES